MPQDAICHSQSAFPSRGATLGAESITEGMDDFYSHAPRGARPGRLLGNFVYLPISTHTPLAGRDADPFAVPGAHSAFLLTRPSRGATESMVIRWTR